MNFEKYLNKKDGREYLVEEARLRREFKKDLFKELGIKQNPKREMLFNLAWEYGHSGGWEEVYNYASDMVGLILDRVNLIERGGVR